MTPRSRVRSRPAARARVQAYLDGRTRPDAALVVVVSPAGSSPYRRATSRPSSARLTASGPATLSRPA